MLSSIRLRDQETRRPENQEWAGNNQSQRIRSISRIALQDTSEISRSAVESKTNSMITKQIANKDANIHSRFSTESTVSDLLH